MASALLCTLIEFYWKIYFQSCRMYNNESYLLHWCYYSINYSSFVSNYKCVTYLSFFFLDHVQWSRDMYSCVRLCTTTGHLGDQEGHHSLCGKSLSSGIPLLIWETFILLCRLFHCPVAAFKGQIPQIYISRKNSLITIGGDCGVGRA